MSILYPCLFSKNFKRVWVIFLKKAKCSFQMRHAGPMYSVLNIHGIIAKNQLVTPERLRD